MGSDWQTDAHCGAADGMAKEHGSSHCAGLKLLCAVAQRYPGESALESAEAAPPRGKLASLNDSPTRGFAAVGEATAVTPLAVSSWCIHSLNVGCPASV
jgi:hypothetical protein